MFILAALYVVAGSVASNPGNAIKGTALIALGVPVFLFWDRRKVEETERTEKTEIRLS
jgi:APA family basic amino acid/polyamine antiporter